MITDDWFLNNVKDARDNGFDLVCVLCGMGMEDADFEDAASHDIGCPNPGRDRAAEMTEFLAKRLSGQA